MVELSPPLLPEFEGETSWIRRKLGWFVALVVVVAAAGGGYWYFLRDNSTPAPVAQQQTSTVENGQLVSTFSGNGTASATLTSKLTFQTSAKVMAVNVKLGDKVEAGQVLASLDSSDAQRKLESARVSLASAQLSLSELLKPATASAIASAQASITSAQSQLATAQQNLANAQGGPDATAVSTADAAVTQAEQSLTSAQNQVQASWISLLTAQRNYCTTDNRLVEACYSTDLPLTQTKIDALIAEIRNPATTAVGTAAQALISANTSYGNSQTAVTNATTALATAQSKRSDLNTPPTALTLQQLQSAIDSANAAVLSAQQKYDDLVKGPTATSIAQQQVSIQSAQTAVDSAQASVDASVLVAPFAGTITAVGINVGDTVSAATAAFTITNEDAIRVDLAVQEADFVGLKAGQYGIATFSALTGHEYVVRIIFVNPTPTTTQGVVSYQVQAEILRPTQLQDTATQQAVVQTLAAVSGGLRGARAGGGAPTGAAPGATGANGTNGRPGGFARTPGAGGTAGQNRPNASGTPGAGFTPPAGGPGSNSGAPAGGAQGVLQALLNAPAPTPGMNATVEIVKSIVPDQLLVPTTAVHTQGATKYVVVKKDDGTTENVTVTTGGSDSTNTAIASGLTAGQTIVVGTTTASNASAAAQRTTTTGAPGELPGGGLPGGGFAGGGGNGGNGATGGVR